MAQRPKDGEQHWASILLSVGKMARPLVLGLLIVESMCAAAVWAVPTDNRMTVFWAGLTVAAAWLVFFAVLIWKQAGTLMADSPDELTQLRPTMRLMEDQMALQDAVADALADLASYDDESAPEEGHDDGGT